MCEPPASLEGHQCPPPASAHAPSLSYDIRAEVEQLVPGLVKALSMTVGTVEAA